jgi:cell division protein ZapD
MRVALTGGIASGKTIVAQRFAELGIAVVDTDAIARLVVEPGTPGLAAIVKRFGPTVLQTNGHLDRRKLRKLIFADERARRDLEAILHPLIRAEADRQSAAASGPYQVIAIPLLTERGRSGEFDRVLVVDTDEETQVTRVMARDGGTREEAMAIVAAQASREVRMAQADDVLENNSSVSDLRQAVDALHRKYLERAQFTQQPNVDHNTPMSQPAEHSFELAPDPQTVVYEQPLNERMRTFLRIEFLYTQAMYHSESPQALSTRAGVASLLEILAITSRSDTRSDVLKELERQAQLMKEFQSKPGVDPARLRSVLSNLLRLRDELSAAGAQFMAPLRDNEFLSAVKHRSAIPGGTCDFDLPDYSFWLNRPAEIRALEFANWVSMVRPLCDGIAELLWLTRANARAKPERALGGIFQLQFDRENPCQLVRVILPSDSQVFPEISGNQHRCTIRFLSWATVQSRPVHVESDVSFSLSCCS